MIIRTAIIASWLCMAGWLVRYEAFPEYFSPSIQGYKGLLSRDVLIQDSWMKIMLGGSSIGYSHTSMDISENNPSEHYVIDNRIHIGLNIMGTRRNIHALTSIMLDMSYNLSRFSFSFSSPAATMKIAGTRKDGDTFEVKTGTQPDKLNIYRLDIPSDVVLYSPLSETALKNLKPGRQATISTIDPISMKKANLLVRALRYEKILISGEQINATVLSSEYQGIKMSSWIDGKGNVLRQESSLGWALQKCTQKEAYAAALEPSNSDTVQKAIMPLIFLEK